jgi:hypothetical protein
MNLVFTFSLFQLVFFHSRLFMLLPHPLWAPYTLSSLGGFPPLLFLGNFVNTCRFFFFFFLHVSSFLVYVGSRF